MPTPEELKRQLDALEAESKKAQQALEEITRTYDRTSDTYQRAAERYKTVSDSYQRQLWLNQQVAADAEAAAAASGSPWKFVAVAGVAAVVILAMRRR